jgi:hypothetical protein
VEVTAALAGGRWTDRPDAVDPMLAAVARAVNDASSDAGRNALLPIAPWLVIHPRVGAQATVAAVVALAGRTALGAATGVHADRLARELAAVLAAPGQGQRSGWWQRHRQHRHAVRVMRRAVTLLGRQDDGDGLLRALLFEVVNAVRLLDALPPVPLSALRPVDVATLPIRVQTHTPDGSESMHYHVAVVLDRWPAPLVQAWTVRTAELRGSGGDVTQPAAAR